jgi:prepilin-type processing-associated H-X9-DG protein
MDAHFEEQGPFFKSKHSINVLFADGSVRSLPSEYLRKNFKTLCSPEGKILDLDQIGYEIELDSAWIASFCLFWITSVVLFVLPKMQNRNRHSFSQKISSES